MVIPGQSANQTATIELLDSVDISQAAELKGLLLEAFASSRSIRIEAGKASSLDITAIQLLWAAWRKAKSAGKEVVIAGQLAPELESQLRTAGLLLGELYVKAQQETAEVL